MTWVWFSNTEQNGFTFKSSKHRYTLLVVMLEQPVTFANYYDGLLLAHLFSSKIFRLLKSGTLYTKQDPQQYKWEMGILSEVFLQGVYRVLNDTSLVFIKIKTGTLQIIILFSDHNSIYVWVIVNRKICVNRFFLRILVYI